jgi:hypothetical protein
MKSYTKVYMKYFGYDISDWIPCEICGNKCTEIHHLEPRSRAKAKLNLIDNLMGLCRRCHEDCGRSAAMNETAKLIHRKKLLGVKIDHETKRYL